MERHRQKRRVFKEKYALPGQPGKAHCREDALNDIDEQNHVIAQKTALQRQLDNACLIANYGENTARKHRATFLAVKEQTNRATILIAKEIH